MRFCMVLAAGGDDEKGPREGALLRPSLDGWGEPSGAQGDRGGRRREAQEEQEGGGETIEVTLELCERKHDTHL